MTAVQSNKKTMDEISWMAYRWLLGTIEEPRLAVQGDWSNTWYQLFNTEASTRDDRYKIEGIIGEAASAALKTGKYDANSPDYDPSTWPSYDKPWDEVQKELDQNAEIWAPEGIEQIATDIAQAGKFDLIIQAMDYVRENYQPITEHPRPR